MPLLPRIRAIFFLSFYFNFTTIRLGGQGCVVSRSIAAIYHNKYCVFYDRKIVGQIGESKSTKPAKAPKAKKKMCD
jgi:hypothetical protein